MILSIPIVTADALFFPHSSSYSTSSLKFVPSAPHWKQCGIDLKLELQNVLELRSNSVQKCRLR